MADLGTYREYLDHELDGFHKLLYLAENNLEEIITLEGVSVFPRSLQFSAREYQQALLKFRKDISAYTSALGREAHWGA